MLLSGLLGSARLAKLSSYLGVFNSANSLLSSIFGGGSDLKMARARYQHERVMSRLDAQIRAQQMIRKVRSSAVVSATRAAALLSTAHIDVTVGTPDQIVLKSLTEADKEIDRILRTT